jgi:predicted porin
MKLISVVLVAGCAFVANARADDNLLKVYGVLDIAVGNQSNGLRANHNVGGSVNSATYFSTLNPNVGSHTEIWSGGLSQDRIGITGSKSFDNGLRLGYLAETGFNIIGVKLINGDAALLDNSQAHGSAGYSSSSANTSQVGQFINREAYLKVGYGSLGELRAGRNQSLITDALGTVAPLAGAQDFSPLGNSGAFSGGVGVSETLRLDDSVKYAGSTGDFNYGLMFAKGNGTALANQGRMYGAGIGYRSGALRLQGAYTEETDALREGQSTTPGNIKVTAFNASGWLVGASYNLATDWNFDAGVTHYTLSAPKDVFSHATLTSMNGYSVASVSNFSGPSQVVQLSWLGADYRVSDKLKIYGSVQQAHYRAYSTFTSGNANWFSMLATYNVYKNTDLYAAIAHANLTNTAATSAIAGNSPIPHNRIIGAGARFTF